jgi:histidyl-tRNA synthetase
MAAGRTSARTGRAITAELKLDEFCETTDLLGAHGIEFKIDFEIVRGLEYYSGTVFEIYAEGLGAQKQICGGGTYELASLFGGREISSTGFGIGFDRIMEIAKIESVQHVPLFLAYTPDVKVDAVKIARELRRSFPVVMDVMGRGLGAQLKAAAGAGAEFAIIIGRNELDSGMFTLRDMTGGQQETITLKQIVERMQNHYSCR